MVLKAMILSSYCLRTLPGFRGFEKLIFVEVLVQP